MNLDFPDPFPIQLILGVTISALVAGAVAMNDLRETATQRIGPAARNFRVWRSRGAWKLSIILGLFAGAFFFFFIRYPSLLADTNLTVAKTLDGASWPAIAFVVGLTAIAPARSKIFQGFGFDISPERIYEDIKYSALNDLVTREIILRNRVRSEFAARLPGNRMLCDDFVTYIRLMVNDANDEQAANVVARLEQMLLVMPNNRDDIATWQSFYIDLFGCGLDYVHPKYIKKWLKEQVSTNVTH